MQLLGQRIIHNACHQISHLVCSEVRLWRDIAWHSVGMVQTRLENALMAMALPSTWTCCQAKWCTTSQASPHSLRVALLIQPTQLFKGEVEDIALKDECIVVHLQQRVAAPACCLNQQMLVVISRQCCECRMASGYSMCDRHTGSATIAQAVSLQKFSSG